ncbi:MAG: phytanoyl-CoA dioxygenase family protein [Flavobacteriales bacterium]|nr:phytanoyl-CoA dioxygenase family protein [Flavobacteriales bacterium]
MFQPPSVSNDYSTAVFRDSAINQAFMNQGYVIIKDVVSDDGLKKLLSTFEGLTSDDDTESFFLTHWNSSLDHKFVHHSIVSVMLSAINQFLVDYKPVLGTYAVKPGFGSKNSEMEIHQDWSFVDERLFSPVSAWLALEDISENEGCMEFFPGSHNVFKNYRGKNIKPPIEFLHPEMENSFVKVPVNKGDAIFLNGRVVHRSGVNFSNRTRIAAMLAAIPKGAQTMAYSRENEDPLGFIRAYRCEDDFYPTFDISSRISDKPFTWVFDDALVCSKEDALAKFGALI